jgi:hypothetical protein
MCRIMPVADYVRCVLIEEIYARLGKAFSGHIEGKFLTGVL